MAVPCSECGSETQWDDQAGSPVCTECGTLVDSNQSILTSNQGIEDNGRQFNPLWNPSAPTTLKSFRRDGWDLSGQGKETKDRKNTYAMSAFIQSMCASMSVPGLAPRATTLFSQAKEAGHYRWGRKAKLTAGAALAIALRESNRADSLRDIAFLLDEPPVSVIRAFRAIVTLLHLPLSPADPSQHLAAVQAHFTTVIGPQSTTVVPKPLLKTLKGLSLSPVMRLASSLACILGELAPQISLLPTPPTTTAIYILSLESEARVALPNIGELAAALSVRFGLAKGVVMDRYKVVQDAAEEWIREVPWLDQFESKPTASGRARSKVSKRLVVARGLKDVLQFQESILRKKTEALKRPKLVLERDGAMGESDSESEFASTTSTTKTHSSVTSSRHDLLPPRKRRKVIPAIDDASLFLLAPLSRNATAHSSTSVPATPPPLSRSVSVEPFSLTSYLLSAPSTLISLAGLPTRLQQLVADRGGAGAEEIPDEDLFDEGELDGILRSQSEIKDMGQILGLGVWIGHELTAAKQPKPGGVRPQKRTGGVKEKVVGSKRINMEALTRLLHGEDEDALKLGPGLLSFDEEDKKDQEWNFYDRLPEKELEDSEIAFAAVNRVLDGDGLLSFGKDESPFPAGSLEDVEDWRPLSPGGGDYDDEEW